MNNPMEAKQPEQANQSGGSRSDAVSGSAADGKLTPAQIESWRNVLCGMFGPYALIMPESDIQKFKDRIESEANKPPNDAHERPAE